MKWFDKWLSNKMKQAWDEPQEQDKYSNNIGSAKPYRPTIKINADDGLQSRGTNFTLYNANGGTVVELRNYDQNTDRHNTVLYVIPTESDLGQQLGHIVTMEALKR